MDKQHIINEIKRTAEANGGVPLGIDRFFTETAIRRSDWHGKYWARWGDALKEAGYQPNKLQGPYDNEFVVKKMISFIRELGKYPVMAELRLKQKKDNEFPSHNVFTRVGKKADLANKIIEYCENKDGFDDIVEICKPIAAQGQFSKPTTPAGPLPITGCVYLMKSGRYYKIGRTTALGKREYDIGIQLPEKITTVHTIKNDDPEGI